MSKEIEVNKFIKSIPYNSIHFDSAVESFCAGFDRGFEEGVNSLKKRCFWERKLDESGFYHQTSCQTRIQMFCIYCPKCGGKVLDKLTPIK